jgi:hypothetical protein
MLLSQRLEREATAAKARRQLPVQLSGDSVQAISARNFLGAYLTGGCLCVILRIFARRADGVLGHALLRYRAHWQRRQGEQEECRFSHRVRGAMHRSLLRNRPKSIPERHRLPADTGLKRLLAEREGFEPVPVYWLQSEMRSLTTPGNPLNPSDLCTDLCTAT